MFNSREIQAIYVMWLRQMKRFFRSKSRLIASVVQPLLFLVILGAGFRGAISENLFEGGDYLTYFAPGIIAMSILFSSMFTGVSLLWDKQFGFLQEVLVAPISRISIIIGRTIGGASTALIQGMIIFVIALGLGVPVVSIPGLILAIIFMIVVSFTAVGFGLALASKMNDFQGMPLIMNLLIMPLLFTSSAFFPIQGNTGIPEVVGKLVFINPIFYMVDGIRGSLTGQNAMLNPFIDLLVMCCICVFMLSLGTYLFNKTEV